MGIKALLTESQDALSPELIDKVEVIFESAVKEKSDKLVTEAVAQVKADHEQEIQTLKESHELQIKAEADKLYESVLPTLSTFLDSAVKDWAIENQVGIDSKLKVEMAEKFLSGIGQMFVESNIEVPKSNSLVEGYEAEIAKLTSQLNTAKVSLMESESALKARECEDIITESVKGLSQVQAEKVKSLMEGEDQSNIEKYKLRVKTFCSLVEAEEKGNEGDDDDEGKEDDKGKEAGKDKKQIQESVDDDFIIKAALRYI